MSALSPFDAAIQAMRGGIAANWGQTYDIYRMTSTTNGSISTNSPIITGFPLRIQRITKKMAIEGNTFDLLMFEFTCDNRSLEIGDVLTENGYKTDNGAYTLAQMRPTRETICAWTPFNVSMSRPKPTAGAMEQQPSSGIVAATSGTYSGDVKATEWPLTLKNGSYAFSIDSSLPKASLYAGLAQKDRVRDGNNIDIPTALSREQFIIYLPLIDGEMLRERDLVNFPNQDRYQIASLYSSDLVGLSGNICVCERYY